MARARPPPRSATAAAKVVGDLDSASGTLRKPSQRLKIYRYDSMPAISMVPTKTCAPTHIIASRGVGRGIDLPRVPAAPARPRVLDQMLGQFVGQTNSGAGQLRCLHDVVKSAIQVEALKILRPQYRPQL